MLRRLATLALFLAALPAIAGEQPKGDLTWVTDLDAAASQAVREDKPLIAYFTFDT